MAAPIHGPLNRDFAERTAAAVRDYERRVQPIGQTAPTTGILGPLEQFVVASDPSEYDAANGLLPLGYRGHVIGYHLRDGLDLADLPAVPDLDTLLQAAYDDLADEDQIVDGWEGHAWVDTYKDDDFGRPVLINICRYTQGQFFRGQILTAAELPGFRQSDLYRGSHFRQAAPTLGEWPTASETINATVHARAGWCAVSPGCTQLIFDLDTGLDPTGSPVYAEVTPATLTISTKTISLADPSTGTLPTQYLYSDRLAPLSEAIPASSVAIAHFDQLTFRWQLDNALCP